MFSTRVRECDWKLLIGALLLLSPLMFKGFAVTARRYPELLLRSIVAVISIILIPLITSFLGSPVYWFMTGFALFPLFVVALPDYDRLYRKRGGGVRWRDFRENRKEEEMQHAVKELRRIEKEVVPKIKVDVPVKRFNPGWHQAMEFVHMVTTARMVAEAAVMRKGSRGAHYRVDADLNDKGYYNITIRKGKDGKMELRKEDLVITKITPP